MKKLLIVLFFIPLLIVSAYNARVGDQLKILISGLDQFNDMIYTVQSDGTINLPYIGDIKIENKDTPEIEVLLKEKYKGILKLPEVIALVLLKSPIVVNVVGGKTSSMVSLPEGSNIMAAIASSSIDPTEISLNRARLLKKDGTIQKINLRKLIKENDFSKYPLESGDTIILRKKYFHITIDNLLKILSLVSSTIVIVKYIDTL
ncbi:polysaccharide biosynthesis/export family protein [bacterium]|nr:polysaccharide biosynthesis/export family protein [bacterium]